MLEEYDVKQTGVSLHKSALMRCECGESWKVGCESVRETEGREKGRMDKDIFYSVNGSLLKCLKIQFIKLMLHH